MADCRRIDDLGRVVIPKGVRTILGIEAGDELDIQIAGDMVCYRKHKPADIAPIKRGRWVKARGGWITPGGDPVWECSECGKGMHVFGVEHDSYGSAVADGQWVACPNCGANMVEVQDG